jgi:hypothetical protein
MQGSRNIAGVKQHHRRMNRHPGIIRVRLGRCHGLLRQNNIVDQYGAPRLCGTAPRLLTPTSSWITFAASAIGAVLT